MFKGNLVILDDANEAFWTSLYLALKDESFSSVVLEDSFPMSVQDVRRMFGGYARLFSINAVTSDDNVLPIGFIGVGNMDLYNRRAEFKLGIWDNDARKAPEMAQEALQMVREYILSNLGLHTLYGLVRDDDEAALQAAKEWKQVKIKDYYLKSGKYINATFVYVNGK